MKIAFFTDTYYPQLNGVTISVDNFSRELRKRGHTVYIFAPKIKKRRIPDENLTNLPSIKVLSSEPPIYIPMPKSYKDYAKIFREDFDLVHAHGNGAFSLLGYQVARMKRIPFVLTFHTLLNKYTHYFLKGRVVKPKMVETGLRLFANLCDGIITPSEKMKKELISYGVKKPIHVIPNFVETDEFKKIKKNYLHKRLKLPVNTPILLTVGRLGKEKNFEFVLDMFHDLIQEDQLTHLVIVGNGTESKNLKQLSNDLGLSQRVHFTGKINQKYMPSVYKDSNIFVFASTSEVHPLVALEAGAAGIPLIVANDSAFTNVVIDGKNGYLLPLTKKKYIEKIQYLLGNQKLCKSMGEYSIQLIEKNFPPEVLTEKLITFYSNLLSTKREIKTLQRINNAAFRRLYQTTKFLDRIFSS
jgi:1,2-diacylglycerol 3-alpha-glucosyltransferase